MGMRAEVQLATPSIGYVGIELGRRQVGVPQHLLDRAEVGAALEQVRGEGMPQEMRVDALRIEARLLGEPPEDQERAGPGQCAAFRVQEQLGAMSPIEVRAPSSEVAAEGLDRVPPDWHLTLLGALPDPPHEPVVELDAVFVEPDRLGDA